MKNITVTISDEEYNNLLQEMIKRKIKGEKTSISKIANEGLKPFLNSLNGHNKPNPPSANPPIDKQDTKPNNIPKKVDSFDFDDIHF